MSLRRSMEQLRPARTQKVDLLEKSQILLQEAKGLDIGELQKIRGGKPRFYTLVDVINNGTKVDTTQGKTSLKWANKSDRLSFEGGDMISAFTVGRRYKPVFVTSKGTIIKLNDILKTDIFGGASHRISLKQEGGAQLMSGGAADTKGVFVGAKTFWSKYEPGEMDSLLSEVIDTIDEDFKKISGK